jgi:hypothetical protein
MANPMQTLIFSEIAPQRNSNFFDWEHCYFDSWYDSITDCARSDGFSSGISFIVKNEKELMGTL